MDTSGEQTVFSTRAHVFQIDPETKKSWIAICQQAVDVSFYHDKARNTYRIISVDGSRPLVNSTITQNMIFTKTSQKFGQWSDSRANTVYGLGFVSEADLAKFIEKFKDIKELTRQSISTTTVPGPEVNGTKEPSSVNKAVFHQRTNSLSSIQIEGGGLRERRNSYSNTANSNVNSNANSNANSNVNSNSLPNSQAESQLKYENDRLKLALAQSSANAKRWEVELQTLKNNNARLTAALQESTSNVEEWKKQLALYKDENTKHRKRVLELESSTGNTDVSQTDEMKDLKKQVDTLMEEKKGKTDEIESLNAKLAKLTSQESNNSVLQKQVQDVEKENASLKQKVQDLEQLLQNAHATREKECHDVLNLQDQMGSKIAEMYELHENIVSTIKKESNS